MFRCKNEETAKKLAKENNCYYGYSVFNSSNPDMVWYIGTVDELRKIGIMEIKNGN